MLNRPEITETMRVVNVMMATDDKGVIRTMAYVYLTLNAKYRLLVVFVFEGLKHYTLLFSTVTDRGAWTWTAADLLLDENKDGPSRKGFIPIEDRYRAEP